jgi:hypothetical protein
MIDRSTIVCSFTCKRCKVYDHKFAARARLAGEDIIEWMTEVREAMATAHHKQSPFCSSLKADLAIPMNDGDTYIGAPVMKDRH